MEKVHNVTTQTWNVSMSNISYDPYALLQQLNNQATTLSIPVIAFLSLSMLIGAFGNFLVIIIYSKRLRKSSSDYFILYLAFLDLLTSSVGIPLEITDLCFPYTFYIPVVCKLIAVDYFTNNSSAVILVAISIDRYKRICQYGKKIRNKTAKIMCFISFLIGILSSWPATIMLGIKTVDLQIPGINGSDCSHSDEMKNSIYLLVYYSAGLFSFISCVIFLSIVYVRILVFISKARTIKRKIELSSKETAQAGTICNAVSDIGETTKTNFDAKVTRTTKIFAAITIAFILSYFPYLAVMVTSAAIPDLEHKITDSSRVMYKFATKSVFLNNAINPLIYSFLSQNFRSELQSFMNCKRFKLFNGSCLGQF